jgi:phenylacetate-CoA ligase
LTNYFRALHYLCSLLRRAYLPPDRLKRYQEKKLRQVIRHAYDNVPFYHDRFRQAGINPNEIATAADLSMLPILRKDEVRKNIDGMISREHEKINLKTLRTSGSTGIPLHFYVDGKEDEFRKARHIRANISLGQKPRDRWVVITSPAHIGEVTKFQRFMGVYSPIPVLVFNEISTQVSIIEKLKPDILDGYSSSLLLLAKEIEKKGVKTVRPRFLIGGAEFIGDFSRLAIEKAFGVPFYDQYGCDEMERIAWQCKEKEEYHIDADSIIVQFVDKNGEEVSAGERGEVVCTSLFNYAMPFIRYAVGDVGIPSDEKCRCGRTLPLMRIFEGRKDSFLVLADGRILSPLALNAAMCMFKFHNKMDQYRIIQRRKDLLDILVKLGASDVAEESMEKELMGHLQETLKFRSDLVTLRIQFVKDIPLDKTGKLRKIISELNQTLD